MKLAPKFIWDVWLNAEGIFVGEQAPVSRVTVEPNWFFNALQRMGWHGQIAHWMQRADGQRQEFEVPSLQSVQWNRSLTQGAATCTITLYNTWMDANIPEDMPATPPQQLGHPGWFTWVKRSAEGVARWGADTSPWRDVLTANALLRTYQGYGGLEKPIAQAVTDGNLTQTGVWLVDDVQIDSSTGILSLSCRDLGSILVDGSIYPPLCPGALYPYQIQFQRFFYTTATLPNPNSLDATTGMLVGGRTLPLGELTEQPCRVRQASTQKDYPPDGVVLNHAPADAVDGDPTTFWYGIGHNDSKGMDWIELDTTGNGKPDQVNALILGTWGPDPAAGSYHFYVSVMENGAWVAFNNGVPAALQATPSVAGGVIPADPHYAGTQYATNIPYVAEGDLAWDFSSVFALARTYNAQRVRVTFTNLAPTTDGPPYYRVGVTDVFPAYDNVANMRFGAVKIVGITAEPNGQGYWADSSIGMVVNFGGAINYGDGTPIVYNQPVVGIAATPDSSGYWLVAADGGVFTYGTAPFLGALPAGTGGLGVVRSNVVGMAPTATGKGYWIATAAGEVYSFGDAVFHGGANTLPTLNAPVVAIVATPSGKGYWLAAADGGVFTFGDAQFYGSMGGKVLNAPISAMAVTPSGKGYYLAGKDGGVFTFGDAQFWGSIPGEVVPGAPFTTSTGVTASVSTANAPPPPGTTPWAPDTAYIAGQWVTYGTTLYTAKVSFTSGTSFDGPSMWQQWGNVVGIAVDYYGDGYWLIDDLGNVTSFGGANNYGSFYSPIRRTDGNFVDWSDVVMTILLWSGWHLYGAPDEDNGYPAVNGIIETTGIPGPHPIDNGLQSYNILPDQVCKRAPMDVIKQVMDIVGYVFWIGDEGEAHCVTPNWWSPGNFDEDQSHVNFVPEVSDVQTIQQYQSDDTKKAMRSEIIISTYEPTADIQGTVTTRYVPAVNKYLHGLPMPLLHNDPLLVSPVEQKTFAQLAGLRLWISGRTGTITISANPCIGVNDQIQLAAEVGQDTYVHQVTGVQMTHNLETGEFQQQLTTNWLGDPTGWAVDFTDPTEALPVTTRQIGSTPPVPSSPND